MSTPSSAWAFAEICVDCRGSGVLAREECPTCKGQGVQLCFLCRKEPGERPTPDGLACPDCKHELDAENAE